VNTALSIKCFVQYRDDALNNVVEYHIAKRDVKAALVTTDKFDNASRKAAAILKVATAQAKAGNRQAAADIAAQIKLGRTSQILANAQDKGFDYRRPQTWGVSYDWHHFFTMTSHIMSVRRAAEVAASAMALSQALELKPGQSYAVLFNDINMEEVIQSLARTHARPHTRRFGRLERSDCLGQTDWQRRQDPCEGWQSHDLCGCATYPCLARCCRRHS
jgi:hypothetical protein